MVKQDVQAVIEDVVRESLGTDNVVDVRAVRADTVYQDDDVLRVTVVIERSTRELDQKQVLSLSRHIRSALERLNEHAFPVISYVSRDTCGAAA